jgi:hypothetical protein
MTNEKKWCYSKNIAQTLHEVTLLGILRPGMFGGTQQHISRQGKIDFSNLIPFVKVQRLDSEKARLISG